MANTAMLNQLTGFTYDMIHTLAETIRNMIDNELILLGIAILLAYYFNKKSSEGIISKTYIIAILSILFFVILKYI